MKSAMAPSGRLEGFVETREVSRGALYRHKVRRLIGGLTVEDLAAYILEGRGFTDVKILQKPNLIQARMNGQLCLVAVDYRDLDKSTSELAGNDADPSSKGSAVAQPVHKMVIESWQDEDEDGMSTIVARCIFNPCREAA
ncbi:MAG: hypothetical protein QW057_02025 [Candidatus Bathyarchaeia archaeon]